MKSCNLAVVNEIVPHKVKEIYKEVIKYCEIYVKRIRKMKELKGED